MYDKRIAIRWEGMRSITTMTTGIQQQQTLTNWTEKRLDNNLLGSADHQTLATRSVDPRNPTSYPSGNPPFPPLCSEARSLAPAAGAGFMLS